MLTAPQTCASEQIVLFQQKWQVEPKLIRKVWTAKKLEPANYISTKVIHEEDPYMKQRILYRKGALYVGMPETLSFMRESSRLDNSVFHIPSNLVPEVAAISVTTGISILGILGSLLLAGSVSSLFLAPLIVSATGGLFLVQAIRRHARNLG